MRHGSLFSGIGGFDLAAEWMGWENVFHCEWNDFGKKVLKYYWPQSISYDDITKTDFTIHRGQIDILTGGFPCQPYSMAGKRKGKEDERHLWPEMLRAIREINPRWIIGENVLGLVNWSGGLVFHEVQSDLEAEGYEVFPYVLPAASVNAPHRRDRVWFVAYAKNNGWNGGKCEQRQGVENNKWEICECETKGRNEIWPQFERYCTKSNVANSDNNGLNECNGSNEINASEGRFDALSNINESNGNWDSTDTDGIGLRRQGNWIGESGFIGKTNQRNNWETFPTVSPICNGNDGISNRLDSITFPKWRKESIKAGGNAIVPQVAFQLFKTIKQYETIYGLG